MRLHNYQYIMEYESEGDNLVKAFSILIPYETNERAVTAQLVAKNMSRIYLREIKFNHDISEFKEEWLGLVNSDSYQDEIIKQKGYCIIPKEIKSKKKQSVQTNFTVTKGGEQK